MTTVLRAMRYGTPALLLLAAAVVSAVVFTQRASGQAAITEVCRQRDTGAAVIVECLTATRFILRDLSGNTLLDRPATKREQQGFIFKRGQLEREARVAALPSAAELRARALAVEAGPGQSPLADIRALSRDLADALRLLAELRE